MVVICEAEFDDIYFYFRDHFNLVFLMVLVFSVILACLSELSCTRALTQPATSP